MKTTNLLLGLLIALSVFNACSNQPEIKWQSQLSQDEKDIISKEIIEVSNKWINDNNDMNPDHIITFWSKSPDLRFAENGVFFANLDSMHSTLKNIYSNTASMNVEWLNRDIIPISNYIALMSGEFKFKLEFKDGSNWEDTIAFTGVFTKENKQWNLIQGHESSKK
ncbi:MAG: nuclear transport factor 2 family protein [Bacteroidota bacterium]